jgi:hypothetical protein
MSDTQKPMSNGTVAAITAVTSIVSCLLMSFAIMQSQKAEFAANAAQLARIEAQNDERAKSVELRLATIESRLMSLEQRGNK